jgi:hypothetical protein
LKHIAILQQQCCPNKSEVNIKYWDSPVIHNFKCETQHTSWKKSRLVHLLNFVKALSDAQWIFSCPAMTVSLSMKLGLVSCEKIECELPPMQAHIVIWTRMTPFVPGFEATDQGYFFFRGFGLQLKVLNVRARCAYSSCAQV